MRRYNIIMLMLLVLSLIMLFGCQGDFVPRDTRSLLIPTLRRSELLGFVAGFGTTFAPVPDLVAMLRGRSSAHMNPRMATIMGISQLLWVYYGLLIASRPIIAWNIFAVLINFLVVAMYFHVVHKERSGQGCGSVSGGGAKAGD